MNGSPHYFHTQPTHQRPVPFSPIPGQSPSAHSQHPLSVLGSGGISYLQLVVLDRRRAPQCSSPEDGQHPFSARPFRRWVKASLASTVPALLQGRLPQTHPLPGPQTSVSVPQGPLETSGVVRRRGDPFRLTCDHRWRLLATLGSQPHLQREGFAG